MAKGDTSSGRNNKIHISILLRISIKCGSCHRCHKSHLLPVAGQKMTINDWCGELARRVKFIRDIYSTYKINLKSSEGLSLSLEEAEAVAAGQKTNEPFTQGRLIRTVNDVHVIYAIAEILEICVQAGLNVSNHLKQLTTGTVDYGTPEARNKKTRFLKDFEFELFIASALIRGKLKPEFPTQPNDPRGDLIVNGIFIEIKHPNSVKQLKKLISKFNKALVKEKLFGVFVVGLEDAYNMGDKPAFISNDEHNKWINSKRQKMENEGMELIKYASFLPQIVAMIQTQSKIVIIEGVSQMQRMGNSFLFNHRPSFSQYSQNALAIAKIFNPQPVFYSQICAKFSCR